MRSPRVITPTGLPFASEYIIIVVKQTANIGIKLDMPNYGFQCSNCHRKFRVYLSYEEYDSADVRCPHCSSKDLNRLISRVRFARSEESRLESLADPSNLAGLEDDPQALGRMMRQMSGELGEELGPEFDEVVERLEKGQSPEDIEKEMPELAEDLGGGMGDMGGMGGMGGMGDLDDLS